MGAILGIANPISFITDPIMNAFSGLGESSQYSSYSSSCILIIMLLLPLITGGGGGGRSRKGGNILSELSSSS